MEVHELAPEITNHYGPSCSVHIYGTVLSNVYIMLFLCDIKPKMQSYITELNVTSHLLHIG